jgi:hypothetical protein
MGEGESVATERPFHIMKAVERTRAKLRIWVASCRGARFERPSIVVVVVGVRGEMVRGFAGENWWVWYGLSKCLGALSARSSMFRRGASRWNVELDVGDIQLMPDVLELGHWLGCDELSVDPRAA